MKDDWDTEEETSVRFGNDNDGTNIGETIFRSAIILSATALWLNGFHNGWIIFMFVIGII